MSTRDLLLSQLYHAPRDTQTLALAARNAPVLYFDAHEPFLPLAAGYTVFRQDGPSTSFPRTITLRPEGKPPAALAIEYAIWWDWDIHHLYELEHVWVYLNAQGAPVRVEGSWHGKFYDLPLRLEEGHPVLLSEPGKHAFAPDPSWFLERQRSFRRPETLAVRLHAHVLINNMFAGAIRQRVFDRVLARSYLVRQAFKPSGRFTQRYTFAADSLIPWPALADWIPQRVNGILERLEAIIPPEDYCALHLVSTAGTIAGLEAAAQSGADVVHLRVIFQQGRLLLDGHTAGDAPLDLEEAYRFLYDQPMGAFLEVSDPQVVEPLAWFLRSKETNGEAVVLSEQVNLLARYNAFMPGGVTAVLMDSQEVDAVLEAAQASRSAFVCPRWSRAPGALTAGWIERIHSAGLGILAGPVDGIDAYDAYQRFGVDVVWQTGPKRATDS